MNQHWRKYIAEFFGTAVLTFAVIGSLEQNAPTAFVAALTLMLLVYTIGGVSGAHVNPAVTVGLWSIGKMRMQEAMTYIVAQLLGAIAAQLIYQAFLSSFPVVDGIGGWAATVAEAIGAFMLVFGISAVVHDKTHKAASGLTVGGSLLLGILLASLASKGIVNPAVSIGLRVFSPVYLIGPLVGGALAAHFYQWLVKTEVS